MTASTLFPAACAIARVPQKVKRKVRVESAKCRRSVKQREEARKGRGVQGHEVAAAIVSLPFAS